MEFQEIERHATYKVESRMGLFMFLGETFRNIEQQRNLEKEKMIFMEGLLVDIRRELRKKAEFDLADRIREELEKVGVTIEDGDNKTGIRRDSSSMAQISITNKLKEKLGE